MKKLIALIACSTLLAGCSSLYRQSRQLPNETNISGAGGLINENGNYSYLGIGTDKFTTIDICSLVVRYELATDATSNDGNCDIAKYEVTKVTKQNRNEIQDYVIAASNQKCGDYIRLLHSIRGDSDVFWGGLSTLFAGAGSVLSHVHTAQVFSAAGAVSSGIRSEISQAYFANLAIEVIVGGINSQRQQRLDQIIESRKLDTTEYGLHGALRDALLYHSSCTAITGLEAASQAITRADNPGALELGKFVNDLRSAGVRVRLEANEVAPAQTDNSGANAGTGTGTGTGTDAATEAGTDQSLQGAQAETGQEGVLSVTVP